MVGFDGADNMLKQLGQLESQVESLQESLQQLRLEHSTLKLEQTLLQAVCDTLHWIRAQGFDQQMALRGHSHDTSVQLWTTRQERDQVINSTCVSSDERLLLQHLSSGSPYFAPTTPPLQLELAAEFELSLLRSGSSALSCNSSSTWGADNRALQHIQLQPSSCHQSSVRQAGLIGTNSSGSGSSLESTRSPLAPDSDDMLFQLRNLLSRPPLADVQALELDQLLGLYEINVHKLCLAHALLDNPFISAASKAGNTLNPAALGQTAVKQQFPAKSRLQPGDELIAAVTKYFHVLVSLVLQGRNSFVVAFLHTNILTGETHEEIFQQIASQLRWAVQRADLTMQQLHRIAAGSNLRKRLLQQLLQEQQKLREQIAVSCDSAAAQGAGTAGLPSCSTSLDGGRRIKRGQMTAVGPVAEAAAAAAGDGPAPAAQMTAVGPLAGQRDAAHAAAATAAEALPIPRNMVKQGAMHMAEQQQLFDRLCLLQKKENMLRACFMCFTLGCLTPLQVSKLMLAIFPYPLDLAGVEFMAEIMVQGKA